MSKTMLDYIHEQPAVLAAAIARRAELCAPFVRLWQEIKPDRLYIVASGSSRNAGLAAQDTMQKALGVEVSVHAPSRLPVVCGARPMLVFVSQGGRSTNTIAAIKALGGYPAVALTGETECPVNDLCAAHLLIPCGEETVGPKTKGYTATVLLLCLMALETGEGDNAETLESLTAMAERLPANIATTLEWYARNELKMQAIEKSVVVGKNAGADAAAEGALKILETVLVPSADYEFEEFLHGPQCALDARLAAIYLLPPKTDADYLRMKAMAQFHRGLCPQVYMVGDVNSDDIRDLCLQTGGDTLSAVFEWVLPCQVMGAKLPATMGIEGRGHKLFLELDKALGIKQRGDEK